MSITILINNNLLFLRYYIIVYSKQEDGLGVPFSPGLMDIPPSFPVLRFLFMYLLWRWLLYSYNRAHRNIELENCLLYTSRCV